MRYDPANVENWLRSEFTAVQYASDGELITNCHSCDDTKGHLYISTTKPVAHCFRCGWGGTHVQLVMEVTGAESYAEAWRWLKDKTARRTNLSDYIAIANRLAEQVEPKYIPEEMPSWYKLLDVSSYISRKVRRYAERRLSRMDIIRYGIGYCDDGNEAQWLYRMIIPVERGFYQGRAIMDSDSMKYLGPKMDKEDRLFNYHALRRAGLRIHVAEGAISAIALGWTAVAVLGSRATRKQMERLGQARANTIIIAFDAGTEFSKSVVDLADYLYHCDKKVIIRQYSQGDPDSCDIWEEKPYDLGYKVFAGLSGRWL